jgi:hypothetical protein
MHNKETLVYKPRAVRDPTKMLHTGIASALPFKGLNSSRALRLIWRVTFFLESNEFGPRKPFWFLLSPCTLSKKGDLQRIV